MRKHRVLAAHARTSLSGAISREMVPRQWFMLLRSVMAMANDPTLKIYLPALSSLCPSLPLVHCGWEFEFWFDLFLCV